MNAPQTPSVPTSRLTPVDTVRTVSPSDAMCSMNPAPISTACVAMNRKNTGASATTDSRIPRMFSVVSSASSAISVANLYPAHSGGSTLNNASPAAAIDTVTVST